VNGKPSTVSVSCIESLTGTAVVHYKPSVTFSMQKVLPLVPESLGIRRC